jgi:Tfp pilus assembly protein PilV
MWIYHLLKSLKKHLRRCSDEQGVSLIEVIAMVLILSIAVVPLSRLSMSNLDAGRTYSNMVKGTFYAEKVMEHIMADYIAGISNGKGYGYIRNDWPGAAPDPPTGYTGTVSVSSEDSINNVVYSLVQVTVSCDNMPDIVLSTWVVDNVFN